MFHCQYLYNLFCDYKNLQHNYYARVEVTGCLSPLNFETPHFIPLKNFKNTLDKTLRTLETTPFILHKIKSLHLEFLTLLKIINMVAYVGENINIKACTYI